MVFTMGFTIKVCSFEILVFGFGEGLWGWDLYVLGSWVSGSWRVGIREISYKVWVEDWNRVLLSIWDLVVKFGMEFIMGLKFRGLEGFFLGSLFGLSRVKIGGLWI